MALMVGAALLLPVTALGQAAMGPIMPAERAALSPDRGMLETGWSVANTACARCHGQDGASTAPDVPNLAGQRTVYLYRTLKAYQERERRNDSMNHAIGFLNEDALLAVAAYYASLDPIRPTISEDEASEGEQAIAGDPFADIREEMKKCVKCHGEDGNASASGMPNLTAQDPAYFVQSMQAYRTAARSHRLMERLVAELDDETLLKMGVFYGVQKPLRTGTTGEGNVDLGRTLAEDCAGCHGADGNAAGPEMPTLAGQDARYFIKAMEAYKEGKRQHEQMFGAVDNLSDEDLQNLAAFYAAQEPVRRNVRTPLTTSEWIARCERCHGVDGNSTDPRFPMLAGQPRGYLTNALESYAGEQRGNSAMHAMSEPLSRADIERIVEHYSTRGPKSVVYMQLPCEEQTED